MENEWKMARHHWSDRELCDPGMVRNDIVPGVPERRQTNALPWTSVDIFEALTVSGIRFEFVFEPPHGIA